MLGVRTPDIKIIAKKIKKTDIISFLKYNKNNYYEELLLEAFVISFIKEKKEFDTYFEKYIKKVDCWSLCDMACSAFKIIKNNKEYYFNKIKELVKSDEEYIVRVGIVLLLDYYIDEKYINDIFKIVDSINREEYYINMAIAWLLSICYIKFPSETDKYLKITKVNNFTYNKTISKICDSYRVDNITKLRLKQTKKT